MHVFRISVFAALVPAILLVMPGNSSAQAQESRMNERILKYVEQDKVYLLENPGTRATKNAEKTIIQALLTEDGPKAARLFQKQLQQYPDPVLDTLSKARLEAYAAVLGTGQKLPVSADPDSGPGYILQFGSFGSREYAEEFAGKIASHVPATVFREGSLYKVRTQKSFRQRSEAEALAATLPFTSFIRQAR